MNEKQAKRLRRAQRRYITEHKHEITRGPTAERKAELLAGVVRHNWPTLNHKQRGRVMGLIRERGL